MPSPIGDILLVTDDEGALRALDFADYETRMLRLLRLQNRDVDLSSGHAPEEVRRSIRAYFEGDFHALSSVRWETGGTSFQRQVWEALGSIPPGSTSTYSQIAVDIGRPSAKRAVGMANGSNPIAIVVPCHRVIGWNGSLTGYGGGLSRKQWLLRHEDPTGREEIALHCLRLQISRVAEGALRTMSPAGGPGAERCRHIPPLPGSSRL